MYSSFDPNNNEFVNKLEARREEERINSIERKRIEIIMISSFMYIHIYH